MLHAHSHPAIVDEEVLVLVREKTWGVMICVHLYTFNQDVMQD